MKEAYVLYFVSSCWHYVFHKIYIFDVLNHIPQGCTTCIVCHNVNELILKDLDEIDHSLTTIKKQ